MRTQCHHMPGTVILLVLARLLMLLDYTIVVIYRRRRAKNTRLHMISHLQAVYVICRNLVRY